MSINIDEIYKRTALNMMSGLPENWKSSTLKVERDADDAIGFSGGYIEDNNEFKSFKFRNLDTDQLEEDFHHLYEIMTENESNKWNQASFTLQPSGEFNIEFEWDQALADDIEKLTKE